MGKSIPQRGQRAKRGAEPPVVAAAPSRADVELALRERVKELNCLYTISRLRETHGHSPEQFLQNVVDCLPPAFLFVDAACARIVYRNRQYVSHNFQPSRWRLAEPFQLDAQSDGLIEVFYRGFVGGAGPGSGDGPFLREEYALMKGVAERVGSFLTHMKAEAELHESHQALQREHQALQEANVALRTVLSRLEEEKREIRGSILTNIQKLLMPMILELELEVTGRQRSYVTLLRQNLHEIASPFLTQLCHDFVELTPVEVALAAMLRNGLSTKEIAQLRSISPATVRRHRENIRRKLHLRNRKVNLITFLQSANARDSASGFGPPRPAHPATPPAITGR